MQLKFSGCLPKRIYYYSTSAGVAGRACVCLNVGFLLSVVLSSHKGFYVAYALVADFSNGQTFHY